MNATQTKIQDALSDWFRDAKYLSENESSVVAQVNENESSKKLVKLLTPDREQKARQLADALIAVVGEDIEPHEERLMQGLRDRFVVTLLKEGL